MHIQSVVLLLGDRENCSKSCFSLHTFAVFDGLHMKECLLFLSVPVLALRTAEHSLV